MFQVPLQLKWAIISRRNYPIMYILSYWTICKNIVLGKNDIGNYDLNSFLETFETHAKSPLWSQKQYQLAWTMFSYLREFNKSSRFAFKTFCFSLMSSKQRNTLGGWRISVLFIKSLKRKQSIVNVKMLNKFRWNQCWDSATPRNDKGLMQVVDFTGLM